MLKVQMKKNFDIEKLIKNLRTATSKLLNNIAEPIKEVLDDNIYKGVFDPTRGSTDKLHGSHNPLHLTGKLAKSNKVFPASPSRLKAVVKNTAKSSKNYKIRKPNGKIYKGTRKSAPVFYGYYQNKGFTTSPKSLIPNKRVPERNFTRKTIDKLESNPKYIKAQNEFAKELNKVMKMGFK